MPRQSANVRRTFTGIVKANIARIAQFIGGGAAKAEDEAIFIVAAIVGAMVLSRGIDDPTLSDRIIALTRRRLLDGSAQAVKRRAASKAATAR